MEFNRRRSSLTTIRAKTRAAIFSLLMLGFLGGASAAELSFGDPEMKLVSEKEMNGRRVLRYEHDSVPEWGYARPQKDYFHILPLKGNPENRPLHVVLHSAGHSGDTALADAMKHPTWFHYVGLADQVVLYLDCRKNRNDWWWGAHSIKGAPGKYADKYSPTEKRVLTSIEWAIRKYGIDRNRVYLSGISMGGSGSLGIGLCRGDIFAAVNVAVPAGAEHLEARVFNKKVPDPPILVNFSAQNDGWCRGQERLVAYFKRNRFPLIFCWGPHGHRAEVDAYHSAAVEFPWRSIRRDRAYPVFANASTDQKFPGFRGTAGDRNGQIGAFFRWRNIKDTPDEFVIELRLIKGSELKKQAEVPNRSTADVSFRRLQQFETEAKKPVRWRLVRAGKTVRSGKVEADETGLAIIEKLEITNVPANLVLERE